MARARLRRTVGAMASADSMRADLRVIARIARQGWTYRWMILLSMAGMVASTGAFGFLLQRLLQLKDLMAGAAGKDSEPIRCMRSR